MSDRLRRRAAAGQNGRDATQQTRD
jgi:hypothetical protein